jgi:hypothetical protein
MSTFIHNLSLSQSFQFAVIGGRWMCTYTGPESSAPVCFRTCKADYKEFKMMLVLEGRVSDTMLEEIENNK